ncbi:MAG: nuclear transport factor 2 family protein [Bacteroidetes bacterium]|nr:nuclear transport factor 2 family protein [Bacteroidota bacterium]
MKTINIILALFTLLIFNTKSFSQTNKIEQADKKEAIKVLQQFQDGYTKRDTLVIDEFLTMFSDDIAYIGIASYEFFRGKESVRKLTIWDWKNWFDLKIPSEKANIRIDNNVAWFEVVGESGPWRNGKTYEIRMTGSLIKSYNKWLFKQICFSYPAPLKEAD